MHVTVVDYGMGNLRSVAQAFAAVGVRATITADPDEVRRSHHLVVPGQGHFGDCRRALAAAGLDVALREAVDRGAPFLGVCVGFQLLFESSDEAPGVAGLGWLRGHVGRLPGGAGPDGAPRKIPHMGWNEVSFLARAGPFSSAPERAHYYFAHSFAAQALDRADVQAACAHGLPFDAAVLRNNVAGVQFHPEKSQADGLALYRAFAAWRP